MTLANPPYQSILTVPDAQRRLFVARPWAQWFAGLWDLVRGSEGTLGLTVSGLATPVAVDVPYTQRGPLITLWLPRLQGESTGAGLTLAGVPPALQPTADGDVLVRVQDNGNAGQVGVLRMQAGSGVFQVFPSVAEGDFTTTGQKGLSAQQVTYARREG